MISYGGGIEGMRIKSGWMFEKTSRHVIIAPKCHRHLLYRRPACWKTKYPRLVRPPFHVLVRAYLMWHLQVLKIV